MPKRLITIPAILLGTPLFWLLSPVLALVALVVDLVTGPRRWRFLRILGLLLQYATSSWLGTVIAFPLWVMTGFGWAMDRPWSRRLHYAVQRTFTTSVLRGIERWLGGRITIEGAELASPGPVIIAARHTSFFDALVPSRILNETPDLLVRHVLKTEMAWDPVFDIYGKRHPNHLVVRGGSESTQEVDAIEAMARGGPDEAMVIFPEGTFPTAVRATRIRERFAEREPKRADRLNLDHLLPPRPGGVLALLRGSPRADLVFIAHTGFEPFGTVRSIIANVPFPEPVRVQLWRVPNHAIPTDPDDQLALIDHWWQRMDDWITTQR